jgi:integrase
MYQKYFDLPETTIDPSLCSRRHYKSKEQTGSHLMRLDAIAVLLRRAVSIMSVDISVNARRAYTNRCEAFIEWYLYQPPAPLLTQVKKYLEYLRDRRMLAPRTVQSYINTIKQVINFAAALNPELAPAAAQMILVKTPTVQGETYGTRLTVEQAQTLISMPGTHTAKGLRDTAILSILVIIGLRRAEVCGLHWGQVKEIDGVNIIADIKSKHGRIRTVKLPDWLFWQLFEWGAASGVDLTKSDQHIFFPITKDGYLKSERGLTPHAIYKLILAYAYKAELPKVRPHDLRRTAASLARKGGASIEQVQIMLGHNNPQTTSRYIGETLDLNDNAVDYSPLSLDIEWDGSWSG